VVAGRGSQARARVKKAAARQVPFALPRYGVEFICCSLLCVCVKGFICCSASAEPAQATGRPAGISSSRQDVFKSEGIPKNFWSNPLMRPKAMRRSPLCSDTYTYLLKRYVAMSFAVLGPAPPVFRRQLGSLTAIWGRFSSAGSIDLDGGFKALVKNSMARAGVVGGVFGNVINDDGLHQELNTCK
jgi:hypothetical protein